MSTEVIRPHTTVSAESFKAVFRRHPAGVAVITFAHGDRVVGFTATSVISVSAAPPLFAFSIDSGSSSWPGLSTADTLAVSFLAAEQVDLSARFATSGIDRFANGGWSRLPSGEPVIDQAQSWIRGRIVSRTPVGSSFLVAVQALESHQHEDVPPLIYHDRSYHQVDHTTAI